LNGGQGKSRR